MLTKTFDPTKLRDRLQMRAIAARRPLSCTFELTYKCNFCCRMCYIRMSDEQAKPYGRLRTVEEWLDMARQVYDAGVLYLNLTGGECTTYPGFARLYRELYGMGFRLSIMSNAGAYTDEIRELFAELPPYGVAITLYGGCNETYEAVTGDPRGFDKTVANVRYLQSHGIPVTLNFTMIKQNVRDYPKVGILCKELGIPYTLITDITAHNRDAAYSDALTSRLSPAERACVACHPPHEVELALANAAELQKELAHYTPPQPTEGEPEPEACIGSYSSAAIYWNGDMNTCVSLAGSPCYKPFEVGFETAWQQLQADHAARFTQPDVCRACPVKSECLHRCAARNFEATGDPQKPDPYTCEYVWLLSRYRAKTRYTALPDTPSCV